MSTYTKLRARVQDDVRRAGWHVTAVFPDEHSAVKTFFAYTVGLWASSQHPELLVFGLKPEVAHAIFGSARERILAGERFTDGQIVTDLVQREFPILFHAVRNNDANYPTTSATAYYGHRNYEVLQLVLSDTQKRMPWDPEYEPRMRASQELLGPIEEPPNG